MTADEVATLVPDRARLLGALEYRAPFLIEKLCREHIVETAAHGEVLVVEMIRYLILCNAFPDRQWTMSSRRIDEVWHQFVLFTGEYFAFCERYFGSYLHHSPGNAPGVVPPRSGSRLEAVEFQRCYEQLFGLPVSELWRDWRAVGLNRRVIRNDALGEMQLERDGATEMITIVARRGPLVSISALASEALAFMMRIGAFYVRELPGHLSDEEKLGIVEVLLEQRVLLLAA
jgi:hypothetical protein